MYIFKFGNLKFMLVSLFVSSFSQLNNKGPSSISRTVLRVGWPSKFLEEHLLYALQIITDGPVHCSVNGSLNPLELEVNLLPSLYPSLFFSPSLRGCFLKRASSRRKSPHAKMFMLFQLSLPPDKIFPHTQSQLLE